MIHYFRPVMKGELGKKWDENEKRWKFCPDEKSFHNSI